MKKVKKFIYLIVIVSGFIYSMYGDYSYSSNTTIIEEDGTNYIVINNNIPEFNIDDINTDVFEKYSKLDNLGRAGVAYANIDKSLMPTKERESIGMIKPSGWHTIKYDIVPGKYLYNRCHLIGYQLTGENDNELNLITCTRQANTIGMLEWENKVSKYIKETGNNVLYRVSPIYEGDNLVASYIHMEALSIQDNWEGIKFNIYVKNIQDGIEIDYSNGDSKLK